MDAEEEYLRKPHRLMREILRNYTSFKAVCTQSGDFEIKHTLGDKTVTISFPDIQDALREDGPVKIDPLKRKALMLNVIRDLPQKETGILLGGIKPVAIGHHVDTACEQLARHFFPELYEGLI